MKFSIIPKTSPTEQFNWNKLNNKFHNAGCPNYHTLVDYDWHS